MWQSVKVLNVFNTLTLEQIFWRKKTFIKKLEYRFLVEATKIEITPFPFKTALSEANVKTNRMATTKWTYHKERSFASNCFIFFENLEKELIWCTNDPNVHIRIFRKHWSLILGCFFPVSILKDFKWNKVLNWSSMSRSLFEILLSMSKPPIDIKFWYDLLALLNKSDNAFKK